MAVSSPPVVLTPEPPRRFSCSCLVTTVAIACLCAATSAFAAGFSVSQTLTAPRVADTGDARRQHAPAALRTGHIAAAASSTASPTAAASQTSTSTATATASLSALPSPSASPSRPPVPNPWLSSQQCFENADETEICIMHMVCMTHTGQLVMLVDRKEGDDYTVQDERGWCPDHRNYRRVDHGCRSFPVRGTWSEEDMQGKTAKEFAQEGRPHAVSMHGRRWFPADTPVEVVEAPYNAVVSAMTPPELEALGGDYARFASGVDASWMRIAEPVGRNSIVRPLKIKWLDGVAYFAHMKPEWREHIWHWSTGAFPLFDAKRQNKTAELLPGTAFTISTGKLDLPPMDYAVLTGNFHRPVKRVADFPPWMQSVWPILVQNHTRMIANGNLVDPEHPYGLNAETLMCAKTAVTSSFKSWLFTGVNEGTVFKMHAWQLAGIKETPYDRYPPRKITILNRPSRGFYNLQRVVQAVNDTGIPFEVVEDLGWRTWEDQVKVFARTGILLSVHGAGLANIIYMPANAVVIEVFPHMYRSFIFRDVAQRAGLVYIPLNSLRPAAGMSGEEKELHGLAGDGNYRLLDEPDWIKECDGPHLPSMDAYNTGACAHRSKWTEPWADIDHLRVALADAIDDIGCRDGFCQEVEGEAWERARRVRDMRRNTTRNIHGER